MITLVNVNTPAQATARQATPLCALGCGGWARRTDAAQPVGVKRPLVPRDHRPCKRKERAPQLAQATASACREERGQNEKDRKEKQKEQG